MDINQIKPSAEQQTAQQYFQKPKAATVISAAARPYFALFLTLVLISICSFFLAKLWKDQPGQGVVVPFEASPIVNTQKSNRVLDVAGSMPSSESVVDSTRDQELDFGRLQASAAGPRSLTSQINRYNQSYEVVAEPRLVLPKSGNTEYPSLAKYEGKIMPKPVVASLVKQSPIDTGVSDFKGAGSKGAGFEQAAPTGKNKVNGETNDRFSVSKTEQVEKLLSAQPISLAKTSASEVSVPAAQSPDSKQVGSLNIQFNSDSQLSRKLREAKRLHAQGQSAQAIAQLKFLLSRHENDWTINNALLQILLEERRWQDGEKLISKLQKPTHKRLAKAHYLQAKGQTENALIVLNESRPEIESLPEYYQLIATLSQRVKHFSEAQTIYKQLLLLENDNGAYWLGLASAQDALGSPKAVKSYWRARQFNSGRRGVMNYINVRIKSLSKGASAEELASRQSGVPL